MSVSLANTKITGTGNWDFFDAANINNDMKGAILIGNRARILDGQLNPATNPDAVATAIWSIGLTDGTNQAVLSCISSDAVGDTQVWHRGTTTKIAQMMALAGDPSTQPLMLEAAFDSFQADGLRINVGTYNEAASGTAPGPRPTAALFYGSDETCKVGRVAYSAIQQDINLGFDFDQLFVFTLPNYDAFDNTPYQDDLMAVGMVNVNGGVIVRQEAFALGELSSLPTSDPNNGYLPGYAIYSVSGGFGAIERISNGFRVPADVPEFIYFARKNPNVDHSQYLCESHNVVANEVPFFHPGNSADFSFLVWSYMQSLASGEQVAADNEGFGISLVTPAATYSHATTIQAGVSVMNTNSYVNSRVARIPNGNQTEGYRGAYFAQAPRGFTVDWTSVASTAKQGFGYSSGVGRPRVQLVKAQVVKGQVI